MTQNDLISYYHWVQDNPVYAGLATAAVFLCLMLVRWGIPALFAMLIRKWRRRRVRPDESPWATTDDYVAYRLREAPRKNWIGR